MRSAKDRIRHTILFEIGLLLIFASIASLILEKDLLQIGGLGISLSLIAMGVNYLYNLAFDHTLLKLKIPLAPRSLKLRAVHTILFESSLLVIALPLIAYVLELSLWRAFLTDIGFTLFTLLYTFLFNWIYDYMSPTLESKPV